MKQREVNRYVKVVALMKRLESERERLRLQLNAAFNRGEECPTEGPYRIEQNKQRRRVIAWKDFAEKLAARFQAEMLVETWKQNIPEVDTSALLIRANAEWSIAKRAA